ncbi:MAG: helicase-exonuclease AddAB subunit AddA, partial [Oscillibacter sp.]|nr:helicase-exonuclease AddAB subunit AddA [Oscillibacter sp.]
DGLDIDSFLVITFTKAAAAELRERIASMLNKLLAGDPTNAHLRDQLLRVYRAPIKTIDAFCTSLLRENTHLLGEEGDRHALTPDFRVLDEYEAALVRDRVAERVLEAFYEDPSDGDRLLIDTLGSGIGDEKLKELVLDLYAKLQSHADPDEWLFRQRDAWDVQDKRLDDTFYAQRLLSSIRRTARFYADALAAAVREMTGTDLEQAYKPSFEPPARGFAALAEAPDWKSANAAVNGIDFPKLGKKGLGAAGRTSEPDAMRMKGIRTSAKDYYEKNKALALLYATEDQAIADLRAVAPAMRSLLDLCTDFSDQEHLALRLLVTKEGRATPLGKQISERYAEILVDEYQDTNDVQNAIFRAVSREGKNLFFVGDVKQSIYRFRLADPTIFLRKYQEYAPLAEAKEGEGRKVVLSQNFRSRKEVLGAVNFIFENILSPEMGEIEYGKEERLYYGSTDYPPREDCETEFHLINTQRANAQNRFPVKAITAQSRFVARRIHELLTSGFQVTDGKTLRRCRADDVAILMRSPGTRLTAYAQALAEYDIPVSFSENDAFFETAEISTAIALLDVIDNPRQDVPLICVLRSPVFGFTPDRLAQIRAKTGDGDFYDALAADGEAESVCFLETLRELRTAAREMSVCRLLWHAYDTLGFLGTFGAMDGGETRRENLIALTRHAEKFEQGGYQGLFAFLRHLHDLLDSDRKIPASGGARVSGVKMMSVHASKGLEFPVVILCDLEHEFNDDDLKKDVLLHADLGLGPKRVDPEHGIKYPTVAAAAIRDTLLRESLSEEARVLYVAMTRAKEKLILVSTMEGAAKRLNKLASNAVCPVPPEALAALKKYSEWILLPLLCRPEAAPLLKLAGAEAPLCPPDGFPWKIAHYDAEDFREAPLLTAEQGEAGEREEIAFDPDLLAWRYPYEVETHIPAKRTATQLKGGERDEEIAENAAPVRRVYPLAEPLFRTGGPRVLTAAERGTATHLVMEHLDFANRDAEAQIAKLAETGVLTPEQAAAVDADAVRKFLDGPVADELRAASRVEREYPFTLLVSAKEYFPEATDGEILLQGVVDCWYETPAGVTVLDFKTDAVHGEEEVLARAETYFPQIR